jgi:hypothetical protein
MRIGFTPTLGAVAWQPFQSTYGWNFAGHAAVYVQYRDRAGNVSTIYSAADPSGQNYHLYLPKITH